MNEKKWTCVEVGDSVEIPFIWLDKTPGGSNLGRAMFQVCIRYKKGKIWDFFVYPRQQRSSEYWHHGGASEFAFTISSHRLPNPDVWKVGWCEEHKAQTLSIYVPEGSDVLRVDHYGLTFMRNEDK